MVPISRRTTLLSLGSLGLPSQLPAAAARRQPGCNPGSWQHSATPASTTWRPRQTAAYGSARRPAATWAGSSPPPDRSVKVHPLPAGTGYANLNTCTFDGDGDLWFTGQGGRVGRLPESGAEHLSVIRTG